jgi:hypothetical protein
MSEYQYYEFQALDRSLTDEEINKLRSFSTRAKITTRSFVNIYHYGDFKGDPRVLMEKYFDAFLYVTNWGTHELSFRMPAQFFEPHEVEAYATANQHGNGLSFRTKDDFIIFDFASNDDGAGGWEEEDDELLASFLPIRSELMMGDHRSLYLAWLLCAQSGELEDNTLEPPVPPGLKQLSAPLKNLVDYLRLDTDLVEVAAMESSPKLDYFVTQQDYQEWLREFSEEQKDQWLIDLLTGKNLQLEPQLRKMFNNQKARSSAKFNDYSIYKRRTVSRLIEDSEKLAIAKQKKAEKKEALARENYLKELAHTKTEVWAKLDDLSSQKRPNYDHIVQLLKDLKEASSLGSVQNDFDYRLRDLRARYAKKASLMRELNQASLA